MPPPDIMDVLGSKVRLRILRSLAHEDMYVSQMMTLLALDGKTIKHHLDILEAANLIDSYEMGRRRYYRLARRIHIEMAPAPNRKYMLLVSSD